MVASYRVSECCWLGSPFRAILLDWRAGNANALTMLPLAPGPGCCQLGRDVMARKMAWEKRKPPVLIQKVVILCQSDMVAECKFHEWVHRTHICVCTASWSCCSVRSKNLPRPNPPPGLKTPVCMYFSFPKSFWICRMA